eukprot:m.332649 g.332649  ORF g.332649 m.332649 type:complete len:234 (+) comp16978_c0_seq1:196-897(+)
MNSTAMIATPRTPPPIASPRTRFFELLLFADFPSATSLAAVVTVVGFVLSCSFTLVVVSIAFVVILGFCGAFVEVVVVIFVTLRVDSSGFIVVRLEASLVSFGCSDVNSLGATVDVVVSTFGVGASSIIVGGFVDVVVDTSFLRTMSGSGVVVEETLSATTIGALVVDVSIDIEELANKMDDNAMKLKPFMFLICSSNFHLSYKLGIMMENNHNNNDYNRDKKSNCTITIIRK